MAWKYRLSAEEMTSTGVVRQLHKIDIGDDGGMRFVNLQTDGQSCVMQEPTGFPPASGPEGWKVASFYREIADLAANVKAPGE